MKVLICILISFFSFFAYTGTEIQNGGAGLYIDGKVATFESAKVDVEEISFLNFPSLFELSYEIGKLSLDPVIKSKMLGLLSPSRERKYYKINEKNLNKDVVEKIKNDYLKELGNIKEGSEIAIFAITNVNTQITMLMPDFFKLTVLEKQVVLFHELMWLTGKVSNLSEMLDLEIKFQRMIEKRDIKSKFDFYFAIGTLFDENYTGVLNSVLTLESQAYLEHKEKDYRIKFQDVFSPEMLAALTHYLRNNILRIGVVNTSELLDVLGEDLRNIDNPFFYTNLALRTILLNENYISNLRELVELDRSFVIPLESNIDEIDQIILEKISNATFGQLNETKFSGNVDFFNLKTGVKMGSFLPVKYVK